MTHSFFHGVSRGSSSHTTVYQERVALESWPVSLFNLIDEKLTLSQAACFTLSSVDGTDQPLGSISRMYNNKNKTYDGGVVGLDSGALTGVKSSTTRANGRANRVKRYLNMD